MLNDKFLPWGFEAATVGMWTSWTTCPSIMPVIHQCWKHVPNLINWAAVISSVFAVWLSTFHCLGRPTSSRGKAGIWQYCIFQCFDYTTVHRSLVIGPQQLCFTVDLSFNSLPVKTDPGRCLCRTTPKPWGCLWGSPCGKLTTGLPTSLKSDRSTWPRCRDPERETADPVQPPRRGALMSSSFFFSDDVRKQRKRTV